MSESTDQAQLPEKLLITPLAASMVPTTRQKVAKAMMIAWKMRRTQCECLAPILLRIMLPKMIGTKTP